MRALCLSLGLIATLASCAAPGPSDGVIGVSAADRVRMQRPAVPSGDPTVAGFQALANAMGPVIQRECTNRTPRGTNCNFVIAVHPDPRAPANAFQTERDGRPYVIFTQALIADARNMDELAFVLGHEAAHHIAGHIRRTQTNATTGAILLGGITALSGGGAEAVNQAQQVGLQVGARSYSKDFELEADALGTIITWRAGFEPERGAAFFSRIPDPGDRFLGTHPPNAARIDIVRETLANLR